MTTKPINDVIITTSNFLREINYVSKLASIIVLSQAMIIHQLAVDSASSTSIIISVQIDFSSLSFLCRVIVHKPVFDPLSNKG